MPRGAPFAVIKVDVCLHAHTVLISTSISAGAETGKYTIQLLNMNHVATDPAVVTFWRGFAKRSWSS